MVYNALISELFIWYQIVPIMSAAAAGQWPFVRSTALHRTVAASVCVGLSYWTMRTWATISNRWVENNPQVPVDDQAFNVVMIGVAITIITPFVALVIGWVISFVPVPAWLHKNRVLGSRQQLEAQNAQ